MDAYKWRICYTTIEFYIMAKSSEDSMLRVKRLINEDIGIKLDNASIKYFPETYKGGNGHGVVTDWQLVSKLGGSVAYGYS